jgi:hypothetical protein
MLSILAFGGLGAILLVGLFLGSAGVASAQNSEIGNVCVRDYQGGATCTANDVRFERLTPVQVIKGCNEEPNLGFTTVVFEGLVSAGGSPDRYDIGLFIALDGSSHDPNIDPSGQTLGALGGDSCYHTFLWGPQTATPSYTIDSLPLGNPDGILDTVVDGPWWNGQTDLDGCGDMETNTAVLTTLEQITVACVDNDGDGAADVSVCASWDNNTNSTCTGVTTAFPGTPSKCSCSTIQFDFTPTGLELGSASAESTGTMLWALAGAAGLLAVVTLFVVWRRMSPLKIA